MLARLRLAICLVLAVATHASAAVSSVAHEGHVRLQQHQTSEDASLEATVDKNGIVEPVNPSDGFHASVHFRFPTGSHTHGGGGSGSNSAEEEQVGRVFRVLKRGRSFNGVNCPVRYGHGRIYSNIR